MSQQRRTDFYSRPTTEAAFKLRMADQVKDVRRVFVIGLVDGRVGGYLQSFAVDGVLYAHELVVASEALRTGLGTGLYVETISIAARSGAIEEVCFGLHTPDAPGISAFKASIGMKVVHLPARCFIPAPLDAFIKRTPACRSLPPHGSTTRRRLGSIDAMTTEPTVASAPPR
jgi:hypothetical protein